MFLFARFIRFYGMTYQEVMQLPLKAFWSLTNRINAISAEEDMRKLTIGNAAQSSEGSKELRSMYEGELKQVIKREEKLDTEGWSLLKQMAGRG